MSSSIKIFIAGHRGLAGSAIHQSALAKGYTNIITKTRSELDLLDTKAVFEFFERERPQWVFLAAAKVGGIYANNTYPVEFLLDNLKIQNNIIEASYKSGAEKLLFLGSSCIYPKLASQPLSEDSLLDGKLEPTNEAYAIAKIAGIKLCNAYNREYGTNFISAMPTNLYGPNDNYHPMDSHVLPALIRRFHEAKVNSHKEVIIWGSGTPKREFLYSDDLGDAALFLMEKCDAKSIGEFINVGTGDECTILELAETIKSVIGFEGTLGFDKSKPDGTPRKVMDVSRINALGWRAKTSLKDGIAKAYKDFLENPNTRL